MVEDVVAGASTRLKSQFARINYQTFSTGLSSGAWGGSGSRMTLPRLSSLSVMCQPAWSSLIKAPLDYGDSLFFSPSEVSARASRPDLT